MDDDNDDGIVLGTINNNNSSCFSGVVGCALHTFNICHAVVTVVLLVGVVLMSMQLSTLQQQVAAEDAAIASLQEQLTEDQATQQDLGERVEQEHSMTLYQMAGTFTLLTCLITTFHITQHLSNFHEPVVQRKILAILWMSPVYSVTSFLSLVFPSADEYLAVIKDFYEAYVIYTFLSFLIAVLGRGNRETAVGVLARHAEHLHTPTRCLNCLYHPPPSTSDTAKANAVLMECQILAMQFVLVRPVTSMVRLVAEILMKGQTVDEDDPYWYFRTPEFYISMVTNVSVFFAFNGLLKFYHAVQEDLLWCRPLSKFLAIKGVVFITFWQGLLIAIIVNLHYSPGNGTGDFGSETEPPTAATVATFSPGMAPVTAAPTSFEGATVDVSGNPNLPRFLQTLVDEEAEAEDRAAQIQNFLICLEMLFFSIAHWCVFPSEEWAPDYRPKQHYAKPGIGLKDFASDIGYIMSSSFNARAHRRSRRSKGDESVSEYSDSVSESNGDHDLSLEEVNAVATIPDQSFQDEDPRQIT